MRSEIGLARKWINKDNSAACVVGAARVRPKEATEGDSAELDWFVVGCATIDRKKCIGLWDVSILRRKSVPIWREDVEERLRWVGCPTTGRPRDHTVTVVSGRPYESTRRESNREGGRGSREFAEIIPGRSLRERSSIEAKGELVRPE